MKNLIELSQEELMEVNAGAESPFYYAGYYAHAAYDWLNDSAYCIGVFLRRMS